MALYRRRRRQTFNRYYLVHKSGSARASFIGLEQTTRTPHETRAIKEILEGFRLCSSGLPTNRNHGEPSRAAGRRLSDAPNLEEYRIAAQKFNRGLSGAATEFTDKRIRRTH
jgi:hypothetical protein